MRLHQALFWILIILLPTQLGKHFWPDFSLVFGLRVDYLSPTFYLTDLLVIGILGSWGLDKIRKQKLKIKMTTQKLERLIFPLGVLGFLLVNVFLAKNQGAALYKLVKIIEFFFLGLYVAKNKYTLAAIRYPLALAVIYSSVLALAQFVFQRSLGNGFWWLGERTFNVSTPGIALATWGGQLIMRPYATFSHPNVLAGFILVSLILITVNNRKQLANKVLEWLAIGLGTVAMAISFSRSAWTVGILVCFWLIIRRLRINKSNRRGSWLVVCCLLLILSVFSYGLLHLSLDEAISRRLQLNQVAIEMIQGNPLIGVGLNNFIPRLSDYWRTSEAVRFLQPVHNIFLLVAAETGLVGLFIFFWFLYLSFRRISKLKTLGLPLYASLTAILLLGLFDHYWLTLQQTQLLFTLILGMSWVKH